MVTGEYAGRLQPLSPDYVAIVSEMTEWLGALLLSGLPIA